MVKRALIGKYYKTKKAAIKAFNKLSNELKEHQSVIEFKDGYMIIGNSQIEVLNSKYYEK